MGSDHSGTPRKFLTLEAPEGKLLGDRVAETPAVLEGTTGKLTGGCAGVTWLWARDIWVQVECGGHTVKGDRATNGVLGIASDWEHRASLICGMNCAN